MLFTDICGSTQQSRQMEMADYGELFARIEMVWQEAARIRGRLVVDVNR